MLLLEDRANNTVAETTVGTGGLYRFANVPVTDEAYTITFSWERNQTYSLDEVVAWGWIDGVIYNQSSALALPDLEISLSGLAHLAPEPDTRRSAGSISPSNPLAFVWSGHPAATRYWVDLLDGESLARVWHSGFTSATSVEFRGEFDNRDPIQPGTYWWAIGGQHIAGEYSLTIYSHLAGLTVTP